jgi:glycosyltransferase involved in cell wall biosynthesis
MQIGIDITGIFGAYRTGVPNLYHSLIEGLAALQPETVNMRFVLINRSLQEFHDPSINLPNNFEFRRVGIIKHLPTFDTLPRQPWIGKGVQIWNRGVREVARQLTGWHRRVAQTVQDIDILEGWDAWLRVAPLAKRIIIITDIIPLITPKSFTPDGIRNLRHSLTFAKTEADCVVTISQHAKQTLMATVGIPATKIKVIYPGIRPVFKPLSDRAMLLSLLSKYHLPDQPYVLSLGYLDPRKNIKGHIQAFERLAVRPEFRDLQMVLVGPENVATRHVLRDVNSSNVRDRIHWTGYVVDADLPIILGGARALLYCSFFEGFGYPVLEAMACGVPVVASNVTSIPEISGDAAILVNPHNVDEIANGLQLVLSDDQLCQTLRERGLRHVRQFAQENWARGHLQVYRECYAR